MFALNMDMLWFAAIEAEKEQPVWAGNFSYRWHAVPVETFSVDSTTLVSQDETG